MNAGAQSNRTERPQGVESNLPLGPVVRTGLITRVRLVLQSFM